MVRSDGEGGQLAGGFHSQGSDGDLPEIEVVFPTESATERAFDLLLNLGGRDACVGGSQIWLNGATVAIPFAGLSSFELVSSRAAEPFYLLLSGICVNGALIPNIGVFVEHSRFTLDYRQGKDWEICRFKLSSVFSWSL